MFFHLISEAPKDPLFGLLHDFQKDPRKKKLFLGIGVYQNEEGKKEVMGIIKKAQSIVKEETANYLSLEGEPVFLESIKKLVLGKDLFSSMGDRLYGAQMVGGTSALRIGGEFFLQHVGKKIFIPSPTWPNHAPLFTALGLQVDFYPYFNEKEQKISFVQMKSFFSSLPKGSLVLFHSCCHNPTGQDLSEEEWKELANLFFQKELFPFFDIAYQGLGDGVEEDAKAIRLFAQAKNELMVAFSCSKNFSLYQQRAGALLILSSEKKELPAISSQIQKLIRTHYSNAPAYGVHLVAAILTNEALRKEWEEELKRMRERIAEMRKALANALKKRKEDFSFFERQKGMFSLCGIPKEKIELLKEKFALFIPSNGRINFAGLQKNDIEDVADALSYALKNKSSGGR